MTGTQSVVTFFVLAVASIASAIGVISFRNAVHSALSLILTLLQSVLASAKVGGLAPDVIANIEAAVTNLLAVQGTPVTFAQLEELRVTTKW